MRWAINENDFASTGESQARNSLTGVLKEFAKFCWDHLSLAINSGQDPSIEQILY